MYVSALTGYNWQVEKVWEVDQAVWKQGGVFHLNWTCSTAWTKYMLNSWILWQSWKLTFWYSSILIIYVHSPMCECNTCDNISLEVFASTKLLSSTRWKIPIIDLISVWFVEWQENCAQSKLCFQNLQWRAFEQETKHEQCFLYDLSLAPRARYKE